MTPDPNAIPPSQTPAPAGTGTLPAPPMGEQASSIANWLRGIRKAARSMLVAQRVGWLVAGVLLAIMVGGFADFFLRAPGVLRLIGLVLAMGVLGWSIWRYLLPAFRFRPSLTEIALRIERSGVGEKSGVRGLLASGLELGRRPEQLTAPALAAPVVAGASDKLRAIRAREVFSPRPTIRGVGAGVAAFMLVFGLAATWPQYVPIGLARILAPWSSAQWPKRTEIADATREEHHPLGTALSLRAALVRSDRDLERSRVEAHYRVRTENGAGPERTVQLTDQNQSVSAKLADGSPTQGTLFERLIEPTGLTAGAPGAGGRGSATARTELEYWFESDDDATTPRRILLIDPPTVEQATAQITLPEYAAKILGESTAGGAQKVDLGPGSDDRAAPAPILAGSRVSVTFEFNKPLALPTSFDPGSTDPAKAAASLDWIRSTLGPEAQFLFTKPATGPAPDAKLTGEGRTWTLSWRHWESVRLIVKPTDEYQISAGEDAAFRFDALKDNPPTASVTTPAEDKSVLPTALVDIAGEARDDVALAWVAIERQTARKNATSEGAAPEPEADRIEIAKVNAADQPADPGSSDAPGSIKRLVTTQSLDLSTIPDLKPGDELWITALAADAYELEGQRHDPVRSSVRKLKILSREQLVEQLWSELSVMRRTAIKVDQDQQDIAKARPPAGPAGEDASARAERAQAGLTERLSRQNQLVQRLQQRVKENGLTDQTMADLLKNASETLDRAGRHSAESSKNLGEASHQQSKENAPNSAGEPELNKAADEQQQVRDELSNLIDMLDQGEDSFTAKRAVERLLEQQKQLRDRTAETGRQTAGKQAEQLSQGQHEELSKIAQDQKALAEQLRDQVRKMQERESKVRQKDAAAADAMAQAAAQSTRDQTPERMDQASKQAENNQTSSAQQQQTQAIQSLEQMLDKMEKAQGNKDETLKRALAGLIDSIKALIVAQKASIDTLNDAAPKGSVEVAKLEHPMILHHQNTLGVIDQANSAGVREIAPVVDKLDSAAHAMADSIPDLREAHTEPALASENTALDRLNEALEIAGKLKQNAEDQANARKRAELRAKYAAALKIQTELRDSAQGLVGADDSRRSKASARLVGQDQRTLKETVDQIRAETKELADTTVFIYAHERLDTLMDAAIGTLGGGTADAAVVRNQTSAARVLKSLADALDDRNNKPDPFRNNEQGGGGGGQGQPPPVVPPAAEIVLLRLMQIEALDMSRGAADAPKPDAAQVADAAHLQRDITAQGNALIKKLEKQGEGGAPPGLKPVTPPKPGEEPEAKPGDGHKPDEPEKPEGGSP